MKLYHYYLFINSYNLFSEMKRTTGVVIDDASSGLWRPLTASPCKERATRHGLKAK